MLLLSQFVRERGEKAVPLGNAGLRAIWPRRLPTYALIAASLLLGQPIVAFLHEALVALAAMGLSRFGAEAAWPLFHLLLGDEIHARIAVGVLSGIHVGGLAVAAPVGDALHRVLPLLFTPSWFVAEGGVVSAVAEVGTTLLALTAATAIAQLALMVAGLLLLQAGTRRGNVAARGHGATLVVGTALEIVLRGLSAADLESLGLSSIATKLFDATSASYQGFVERYGSILALSANVARLLATVGMATGVVQVGTWLAGRLPPWGTPPANRPTSRAVARRMAWQTLGGLGLIGLLVPSPLGSLTLARTATLSDAARFERPASTQEVALVEDHEPAVREGSSTHPTDSGLPIMALEEPAHGETAASAPRTAEPLSLPATGDGAPPLAPPPRLAEPPQRTGSAPAAPAAPLAGQPPRQPAVGLAPPTPPVAATGSIVRIARGPAGYQLTVNGSPERIRGMGYVAPDPRTMPPGKARLYELDFRRMREAGVNTVLGWYPEEFDELTLQAAHRHGLGVVMPHALAANADYQDPAVGQAIREQVRERVARYKDHPALRMWGLGNDVFHRLGKREERKTVFGDFLVGLADAVHRLDPYHPVLYTDGDALHVPYVLRAIEEAAKQDGDPRRWLVLGLNTYEAGLRTAHFENVLRQRHLNGWDHPLLVSEFNATGLHAADRPRAIRKLLTIFEDSRNEYLGIFYYTWSAEGRREAIDRQFGLVGADRKPVDRTLDELGGVWRRQEEAERKQAGG